MSITTGAVSPGHFREKRWQCTLRSASAGQPCTPAQHIASRKSGSRTDLALGSSGRTSDYPAPVRLQAYWKHHPSLKGIC